MFEGKVEDSIYLGLRSDTIYALVGRYMDEKCLQSTVFAVLPSSFGDTTFIKVVDRGCHGQIPATYLGQYFEARCWKSDDSKTFVRHVFKRRPWDTHGDPELEPRRTIEYELNAGKSVQKIRTIQFGDSTGNSVWYLPYRINE